LTSHYENTFTLKELLGTFLKYNTQDHNQKVLLKYNVTEYKKKSTQTKMFTTVMQERSLRKP